MGRIPRSASYPTAVAATPNRRRMVWLTARGLGVGPNPHGPNPKSPSTRTTTSTASSTCPRLSAAAPGSSPSRPIADPQADAAGARQIVPSQHRRPPAGTPIRGGGPIKHVFYVVKENRTYDQMLGDDPRGDGDPGLTLFGQNVTPNLHALAKRFPLLDHVYANSEASIDGHYWTAAGAVSDYVVKNWHQNYAGRGRPYDFGSYVVSAPPRGYIFERMLEREGISFFNYGEALAGLSPFPDKDRTPADRDERAGADPFRHAVRRRRAPVTTRTSPTAPRVGNPRPGL